MAKCETCDSVHWQRQQSSVQVREPETGVEKVKRKWLQRTGPQVLIQRELMVTFSKTQCHYGGFCSFAFFHFFTIETSPMMINNDSTMI